MRVLCGFNRPQESTKKNICLPGSERRDCKTSVTCIRKYALCLYILLGAADILNVKQIFFYPWASPQLDLSQPLEVQGPLDVIIHKLTDLHLEAEQSDTQAQLFM